MMTFPELETQATSPARYQPTLRDMVMLETPFTVKVSPNGAWVALLARHTNWKADGYDSVGYVYDVVKGRMHRLNHTGSINQMEWVTDETLAVLKVDSGNGKAQLWLYEGLIGGGWQVTDHKTGVLWFQPFAEGFLFKANHPERDENQARADRFGKYTHFEQEVSPSALYYVGLASLRQYQAQVKAATEDEAKKLTSPVLELSQLFAEPLSIQGVIPSPAGDAVYLNCWQRDDLVYYRDTRIYRLQVDAPAALAEYLRRESARQTEKKDAAENAASEDTAAKKEDLAYLGTLTRLNLPGSAHITQVSPDGRKLLLTYPERDAKMYTREDLWIIPVDAALRAASVAEALTQMRNLSAPLDRTLLERQWSPAGIFATYADSTCVRLAHFTEEGDITPVDLQGVFVSGDFHISASGQIGLVGANATTYPEAYLATPVAAGAQWHVQRLSNFGQAIENWDLGVVETIRWTSKDGTEIEGVLRKPTNFDPDKQYPLVFVVHGGPTWFSPAYRFTGEMRYFYPIVQLLNQDVLVLHPNYRGSIGRGQAFMELNVNNLGVGDLWDLESAIEDLTGRGWIDPERVGCMGWSQGGYISAFAGLHSDKFKAVSVGAGISDWYTYHISNDLPHFTTDYLSASPFHNRELYFKTAPITNLTQARTPMLIQHGAEDRRVPLANALELYRGLQAVGVPVELFIYPGAGHAVSRPRGNHAVLHQNLTWFSHYLLGTDLELE